MSIEFVFVSHGGDSHFSEVSSRYCVASLSSGTLLFKHHHHIAVSRTNKISAWLIGDVDNIDVLRRMLAQWGGETRSLNSADIVLQLQEQLGERAFSLAEGDFCLFMQKHNHDLVVVTESRGVNQVSMIKAEQLWITNSLALVRQMAGTKACHRMPVADSTFLPSDDFPLLTNIIRLQPGSINTIARDSQFCPYLESRALTAAHHQCC
ncbi:carbapenam-3-carboxylate synthase domain-containing protein [Erwinia sp. V71]|uniref:carbapenam-3-carboxylate synthase domain-containing protein n=1 Tax=Erwinia sp. V71 TaxID=3369424 RepID=UPI003F6040F7